MEVIIRVATEHDLAHILAIYQDAGIETCGKPSLEAARRTFARMASYPSYKVYVAEEGGRIAGALSLLIMDNLANGSTPSGIVEDVAVLRSFQGKGIGTAMMERAIRTCRDVGCYKVMLSSNARRTAAHKFYESLGFVRHGFSYSLNLASA